MSDQNVTETPTTETPAAKAPRVKPLDVKALAAFVNSLDKRKRPDVTTADGYAAAVAMYKEHLAAQPVGAAPAKAGAADVYCTYGLLDRKSGTVTKIESAVNSSRTPQPTAGTPAHDLRERKRTEAAMTGLVCVRLTEQ